MDVRYSVLKPGTILEKILMCNRMLHLFGLNEALKEEARQLLNIKKEPGVDKPFSLNDFIQFFSKKESTDFRKYTAQIISLAKKLEKEGYLTFAGNKGYSLGTEKCYYMAHELTKLQGQGYLHLSKVLGLELVYTLMSPIIAHITGTNANGDVVGGSGILVENRYVLTCAHVINDIANLDPDLLLNGLNYRIIDTHVHAKIDVGYIEIDNNKNINLKDLSFIDGQVLEPLIVLGFPPIPRSVSSKIVAQTGEVTGYIGDYDKNTYMLFSAISRPGNSGGPVISGTGQVLGIVSQELSLKESGNFPFFSAVPTSEILKALQDMNAPFTLPVDDYS